MTGPEKPTEQDLPPEADGIESDPAMALEEAADVPETGSDKADEVPKVAEEAAPLVEEEATSDAAEVERAAAEPAIPEPAESPAPVAAAAPTIVRRGPGFFPLVLGGIVAAGVGFGAARYVIPEGWSLGPVAGRTDALKARLDTQAKEIAALQANLKAVAADAKANAVTLPAGLADLPAGLEAAKTDLAGRIDALNVAIAAETETRKTALAALDARLSAVEQRPATGGGVSSDAIGTYERDVQALRDTLAAETTRTAALAAKVDEMSATVTNRIKAAETEAAAEKAKAEAAAQVAAEKAALVRIDAALEAGGGFAQPLSVLTGAGIDVPAALSGAAEAGVPTLAALQETFPGAARAALAASIPEAMGKGVMGRLTAFFQAQTGARSLTPRAGDGPDAVLSRAEAALKAGDPAQATAILAALPAEGQAAMADWVAQAKLRIDALAAAKAVASALNGE